MQTVVYVSSPSALFNGALFLEEGMVLGRDAHSLLSCVV